MKFVPEDYQILMIQHILDNPIAALTVSMGLGKTASTLAALKERIYDRAMGALVIAPLNVSLLTWPAEIELWNQFKDLNVVSLRTKEGLQAWRDGTADIYLINWEYLPSFIASTLDHLKPTDRIHCDTVVYDELSKAKSHSSKRVKMWRRFRYLFKFHIGLTGTPMPNSYMDLFSQFRLLDGGKALGTSFLKFRDKYFTQADYMGYRYELKPGAKEQIEAAIAPYTLTLRREDHLHIPPVHLIDREVVIPPEVMKDYRKLEKQMLVMIDNREIEAVNAASLVGKLLQFVSGAIYEGGDTGREDRPFVETFDGKMRELEAIRKEHPDEPMLVVVNHCHERRRILKKFPEAVKFSVEGIQDWNAGKIKMLVVHPLSAGHGLNLQFGGHIAVWFSLTYSRDYYDQTNSRLARKGQEAETIIYRLVCPMTVDHAVIDALEHKGNEQNGLMLALKNLQTLAKYGKN